MAIATAAATSATKQMTAAVRKSVKEKPQAVRSPSSGISIEVKFLPCLRRV